ncbi:hypothetical protein E3N88_21045 [Mikania micrantha]|uniref:Chromo domain-containing protein n=1 Tax=Mikania micrantha TaxID=192012 RepID=A0A5N6NIU5_9ASTR|nr:hypothetical protein E3N88_21045 [Mikania micrantha]
MQAAQSAIRETQNNMSIAQEALISDVSTLAESLEDQKKTMNKVLVQLSLLTKQSKLKGVGGNEGETAAVTRADQLIAQVLVQWEGLPQEEATWEDQTQFYSSFPEMHLEDKVKLKGEGNVMSKSKQQPNNEESRSPDEEKNQPKLRRSNRARKTTKKWEDCVG